MVLIASAGCTTKQSCEMLPKAINIPLDANGLFWQWYWFKASVYRERTLSLPHLISSTDSIHIRFWNDRGSVVDVWSKDGKVFCGIVLSYVDGAGASDGYPKDTRYLRDTIGNSLSAFIFDTWRSVADIPDYRQIKTWSHGFDGIGFSFEVSTPLSYSCRTYWGPSWQSNNEGSRMMTAINKIDSALNLIHRFGLLYDTLPIGIYETGGGYLGTIFKPYSNNIKRDYIRYAQSRKEALDRVHDTSYYKSNGK